MVGVSVRGWNIADIERTLRGGDGVCAIVGPRRMGPVDLVSAIRSSRVRSSSGARSLVVTRTARASLESLVGTSTGAGEMRVPLAGRTRLGATSASPLAASSEARPDFAALAAMDRRVGLYLVTASVLSVPSASRRTLERGGM